MSNQHVLKIHPAPLADLLSGAKTAEVRRNDRGFQVGDTVRLMEVNPLTLNWTGRPDLVRTISHIQTGHGLPDSICVLSYAQPAAGEQVATWVALTAAGQLRKGDKIRFRFGEETLTETVAMVLEAGTEREEIVYNRRRNFYFITGKALAGTSSAKHVEVLRTMATPRAAAHGGIPAEVLSPFLAVADAYDPAEDDAYVPAKDWMMEDALRLTLGQFRALKRAAAHGDEVVTVVGTVPDRSGFKSLDFQVDLQDLPDGTRLYAQGAGGAST